MTPRILLLVFATAAFVGIWKNLDEGGPRNVAQRKLVRTQPVAALTHRVAGGDGESVAIPLPADLSPGTYRVLNTRGFEVTLRWTADDLPGRAASRPPRELYTARDAGGGWYFVRLDEPVHRANKKYDFTGYVSPETLPIAPRAALR